MYKVFLQINRTKDICPFQQRTKPNNNRKELFYTLIVLIIDDGDKHSELFDD